MYNDEGSGRNSSYGGRGGFGGRREGGRGGSYSGGSSEPKPVKAGDEVEVKIEAVASKGDGIAKKDGFVIFIKGAKEGETVKARITEVKERFAIGEIIG
jgi:predicted RNA-binding protein with TRAM domain